ncbi:hypothetical protein DAPPUDRAFT_267923 [Daphnia pulex]|uniref:Uncharacterized protein n=1 Tax=Daphnia pulex TaxID=6669 RepID=E9HX44_DAPPU|nr:hypothetical protein DAPPUDRAFT_268908 [Daphnia pulex]EFX63686.1 hypothetical protein DAPPUDRAFT_267923 [Daphnia pulex]|eukprot:EFX63191.1 hypothetical protein DAPPUDRAFT_268908 [Daphnia pulex]
MSKGKRILFFLQTTGSASCVTLSSFATSVTSATSVKLSNMQAIIMAIEFISVYLLFDVELNSHR